VIRGVGRVLWASPGELVVELPGWPGQRPGQFAMLGLDPLGLRHDPLLPRPMTVYRGDGERLEFRFKAVGRGTELLGELPEGAPIGVLGPLGNGFPDPAGGAILVGGGTGIASLYELAAGCSADVRILLGGRTAQEILGLDDFRMLPVDLALATEDGSLGHRGVVTDLLKPGPGDEVYACGPKGMMHQAYQLARAGSARCWVSVETRMACGFGVCLGCAIETTSGFRQVCGDGPVFDAEEIVWDALP
jgi:dihydroorotate dehydrogenase electron transfer subunit